MYLFHSDCINRLSLSQSSNEITGPTLSLARGTHVKVAVSIYWGPVETTTIRRVIALDLTFLLRVGIDRSEPSAAVEEGIGIYREAIF